MTRIRPSPWPVVHLILCHFLVAAESWKTQVNITMCNWHQFRAIQLQQKPTILLNGGSLWWQSGYSDGTVDVPESDGNAEGTFFSLPLADSFDVKTTNLSGLFSRGPNPVTKQANFEGGAMFGNNEEIILYGGLTRPTDSQATPGPRELLGLRYSKGVSTGNEVYFFNSSLPTDLTRYVTSGGQVSVPSENLAFYFGGMRGQGWGPIASDDASANTTADTLIMLNLTAVGDQKVWRNSTLPKSIMSRADAQLIWVPVSEQGVLVAIGGVKTPEYLFPSGLSSSQQEQDSQFDLNFMREIALYDIAQDRWYLQNTTGDVPPNGHASFCSTLASSSDGSSHNIYIYGGYSGQNSTSAPYDDVYILSLPSFVWIKAYNGTSRHGRSGHQCFGVLPSHMLVVGGLYKDPSFCLEGGILQTFSLNDLEFQTTYSPESVEEYRVPNVVTRQIGGTAKGKATQTAPASWGDPQLKSLFGATYTKSIATWYPYSTSVATTSSSSTTTPQSDAQEAHWIVPVTVGTVIPVAGITCTIILWVLLKRKHHLRPGQCRCSPGKRHWVHKFCPGTNQHLPGEIEGNPIEPEATRPVRSLSDMVSELPAPCLPSRNSNDFSIAATPVQMYCDANLSYEAPGNDKLVELSSEAYDYPSDGAKAEDCDGKRSPLTPQ